MALARLLLKNLQPRGISSSSAPAAALLSPLVCNKTSDVETRQYSWVRRFGTEDRDKPSSSDAKEIAVSEKERDRDRKSLWKTDNKKDKRLAPFDLQYIFPSRLGDALLQATQNINSLFQNVSPSRLLGRLKEDDKKYVLKYKLPGLTKEDIKITVKDGFLIIQGEHKEEEAGSDEDDHWATYGFYTTTVMVPEDAKVEEIQAKMKDGVLSIAIPKGETPQKQVKEVPIQ